MTEHPQLKRAYAFTILPSEFIRSADLSHEAFRIYCVLCMHAPGGANENATVFPDYERIKALTGVRHNMTVATRMRELEAAGWLQRTKRFGQSTVYTLTIPSPREPQSVTGRTSAPGDVAASPSSGALVHAVNDSPSPREPQSVTPSKTNKNHLTRTKKQESRAARETPVADPVVVPDHSGEANKKVVDPQKPKTPSGYGDCFAAVAAACSMDAKVPMLARRISAAAKYLAERGVCADRIGGFNAWWAANDWRGKRGDTPTPERIVELWLQYERGPSTPATPAVNKPALNGRTYARPQAAFTDEQRRAIEDQARRELEEEDLWA